MTHKHTSIATNSFKYTSIKVGVLGAIASAVLVLAGQVHAQNYQITQEQRATAQQVASRGIPVAELKSSAPNVYTVKKGDTLWAISGLYLTRPWRWPELWGMNLDTIKNPHLIYPGQVLYLDIRDSYARLGVKPGSGDGRLSPSVRGESLEAVALPTIRRDLVQPFLAKPVVKSLDELERLPVVLGSVGQRLVLGSGDSVYVKGTDSVPLSTRGDVPRNLSVFRDVKPLKDPDTKEILGYEGEQVAETRVVVDEYWVDGVDKRGNPVDQYIPGKLEITKSVKEVRIGDRLNFSRDTADYDNFVPRVPPEGVVGKVISIYGDVSINDASTNQVVAINVGADQGLENGHVFQVLKGGRLVRDPDGARNSRVRLPDEQNGYLLVFRVFDRVAYGLLLDTEYGVSVGDKLVAPE